MSLEEYRERIDEINLEILKLLSERMDVVRKIGDWKEEKGMKIEDEDREIEMYEDLREKGKKLGLDRDFVKGLFERIVKESKKKQNGQ